MFAELMVTILGNYLYYLRNNKKKKRRGGQWYDPLEERGEKVPIVLSCGPWKGCLA